MPDARDALKLLGAAFIDAWYLVDEEDRVVDFNPAFHALFPRAVARGLKGMGCRDACHLPVCATEKCLRQLCAESGSVRLDEVEAELGGEKLRLIVSAVTIPLGDDKNGALIVLRNVTDDARIQQRYQQTMDRANDEKAALENRLHERTRQLLAANDELNRLDQELARLRRGE